MIKIHSLDVAYMAVPKAACSTVKALLAEVDADLTDEARALRDEGRFHTIYQTRRFHPKRWDKAGSAYKFTVLRDPIKRLISAYLNWVVEREVLKTARGVRRNKALCVMPDPDAFFQSLQAYQAASSCIKHHTLPMWMFAGKDPANYDKVYTTSSLPQLVDDLSDRAGRALSLPKVNATTSKLSISDLAPKTIDALREYTAPDYAYFASLFPDPAYA